MSLSNVSGKEAVKTPIQGQYFLVLPIDDARNNEKFRQMYPYIKFEGYSVDRITPVSSLDSTKTSRPETKTMYLPTDPGHAAPGQVNNIANDPDIEALKDVGPAVDDPNVTINQTFLFHQIAQESYTKSVDEKHYAGSISAVKRDSNAILGTRNAPEIDPPTNISVPDVAADVAAFVKKDSLDGLPTYEIPVSFDASSLSDDYEIRIVKL